MNREDVLLETLRERTADGRKTSKAREIAGNSDLRQVDWKNVRANAETEKLLTITHTRGHFS